MIIGVGLVSGGLDSILAVKVLQDQGIRVIGISFVTPFFGPERAKKAAEMLNFELRILDVSSVHIEMLRSPKHGYGKQMNPCIDCHALMFREAGKVMEAEGADFLFSGEVLNERPMSQTRRALKLVAKESGYSDLILRPLSAKLLPETLPELERKVDRERLLDISGRVRKRQIELAEHYGIKEYAQPAGGCLLTEPSYTNKLQELMKQSQNPEIRDFQLLVMGRHFRLDTGEKVIIGRNHEENIKLLSMKNDSDAVMNVRDYKGPVAIIPHNPSEKAIAKAASICIQYSDTPIDTEVAVVYNIGEKSFIIYAKAADKKEINAIRI